MKSSYYLTALLLLLSRKGRMSEESLYRKKGQTMEHCTTQTDDTISRQAAIDAVYESAVGRRMLSGHKDLITILNNLPSTQPEIIRCKDCKHWRQQTNYAGAPLSFGFCESDDMWQSLYGETCEISHIDTDDDFYCGYAKRRTDD